MPSKSRLTARQHKKYGIEFQTGNIAGNNLIIHDMLPARETGSGAVVTEWKTNSGRTLFMGEEIMPEAPD
jgi:hypothetical protein